MATTVIRVTSAKPVDSFDIQRIPREMNFECAQLARMFRAFAAGVHHGTVTVAAGGTTQATATGTLTLSSATGAVGGVINGVAVTVTASGGDAATATAIANAINASTNALVDNLVVASAAGAVVTVSAYQAGLLGNAITLAATGTGVTASGARLTGGAGDDVAATTYNLA